MQIISYYLSDSLTSYSLTAFVPYTSSIAGVALRPSMTRRTRYISYNVSFDKILTRSSLIYQLTTPLFAIFFTKYVFLLRYVWYLSN